MNDDSSYNAIYGAIKEAAEPAKLLDELTIQRRARLVATDFAKIDLKYRLVKERYPIPNTGNKLHFTFAGYELLGSQCNHENAVLGDRNPKPTSISGAGFNKENLLFYARLSDWGHKHIPHLWPDAMLVELANPNQHIDLLYEIWWLSKFDFVKYPSVKKDVPLNKGTNVDWSFTSDFGLSQASLRVEVKRRITDIKRKLYNKDTIFDSLLDDIIKKFPEKKNPDEANIACVQLFEKIDMNVRVWAKKWLDDHPKIDCLCFSAYHENPNYVFHVVTNEQSTYLHSIIQAPSGEDDYYVGPLWFPRTDMNPLTGEGMSGI